MLYSPHKFPLQRCPTVFGIAPGFLAQTSRTRSFLSRGGVWIRRLLREEHEKSSNFNLITQSYYARPEAVAFGGLILLEKMGPWGIDILSKSRAGINMEEEASPASASNASASGEQGPRTSSSPAFLSTGSDNRNRLTRTRETRKYDFSSRTAMGLFLDEQQQLELDSYNNSDLRSNWTLASPENVRNPENWYPYRYSIKGDILGILKKFLDPRGWEMGRTLPYELQRKARDVLLDYMRYCDDRIGEEFTAPSLVKGGSVPAVAASPSDETSSIQRGPFSTRASFDFRPAGPRGSSSWHVPPEMPFLGQLLQSLDLRGPSSSTGSATGVSPSRRSGFPEHLDANALARLRNRLSELFFLSKTKRDPAKIDSSNYVQTNCFFVHVVASLQTVVPHVQMLLDARQFEKDILVFAKTLPAASALLLKWRRLSTNSGNLAQSLLKYGAAASSGHVGGDEEMNHLATAFLDRAAVEHDLRAWSASAEPIQKVFFEDVYDRQKYGQPPSWAVEKRGSRYQTEASRREEACQRSSGRIASRTLFLTAMDVALLGEVHRRLRAFVLGAGKIVPERMIAGIPRAGGLWGAWNRSKRLMEALEEHGIGKGRRE